MSGVGRKQTIAKAPAPPLVRGALVTARSALDARIQKARDEAARRKASLSRALAPNRVVASAKGIAAKVTKRPPLPPPSPFRSTIPPREVEPPSGATNKQPTTDASLTQLTARQIRRVLLRPGAMRSLVALSEILQPPVALREKHL